MSLPTIFLHNIETICPLLGSNESLHATLVPSRFSSRVYERTTFWGKVYSKIHSSPLESLTSILQTTMLIFFNSLQKMVATQEIYLRILKEVINGVHPNTEDLENCRSELKHLYDALGPLIKKLKKSDTVPVKELRAILNGLSTESRTVAGRFSMEYLNQKNKRIAALIHLECVYGALLPYGELMLGIYSDGVSLTEKAKVIFSTVFLSVDFKISYLALNLLHSLIQDKLPEFSEIYYLLFKKNISLIETSEWKYEALRQGLQPGMQIDVSKYQKITLGDPINYSKNNRNRITYTIAERPTQMIVFYPNRIYQTFYRKLMERDSRAIHPNKMLFVDPKKGCWSIEESFSKQTLPFPKFLDFIRYLLQHGPLCSLQFSELTYERVDEERDKKWIPRYPMLITEEENDYDAFLTSLIEYYSSSPYTKEILSLYYFLALCLEPAKKEYKNFFIEFAADVASLPLHYIQSDVDLRVSIALGKKGNICGSKKSTGDYFSKKCQTFAQEVLELREGLLLQFRSLSIFQKDDITLVSPQYREKEDLFLNNFIMLFPPMVQSWIMPPPEIQKKLFDRLLQTLFERCSAASSS